VIEGKITGSRIGAALTGDQSTHRTSRSQIQGFVKVAFSEVTMHASFYLLVDDP
jgi:hypothetical protein